MSRRGYSKTQKTKGALFTVCCIAAFVMAAAVIAFVVYVLVLRTNYKKTALEINEAFRTTAPESVLVAQGDTQLPADRQVTEYYNKFLLYEKTVVFNRKKTEKTEKTISIIIKDCEFDLTGVEDGSAVAIRWKTPEKEEFYTVRTEVTFIQLDAYFQNYKRKVKKG